MPLTANGKVDRRRLPEPDEQLLARGTAYVAPRNAIEEKLVEIWQEILGREKIGVRDNFFELGGHSIKAIQLTSRINLAFSIKFSILQIFEEASIENIAEQIAFVVSQARQGEQMDTMVQIELKDL